MNKQKYRFWNGIFLIFWTFIYGINDYLTLYTHEFLVIFNLIIIFLSGLFFIFLSKLIDNEDRLDKNLDSQKIDSIFEEQIKKNEIYEKDRKILSLLSREGKIRKEDIVKYFNEEEIYFIYVYGSALKYKNNKSIKKDSKRDYPEKLIKLGFTRVDNFLYLIKKSSLDKNFQNFQNFEKILREKIKSSIEKEVLDLNNRIPLFSIENSLKRTFLIGKTSHLKYQELFDESQYYSEESKIFLLSLVNLKNLEEEDKIELRNIIFNFSFEIFFEDNYEFELKQKVISLEKVLKKEFNISKISDYLKINKEDIKQFFVKYGIDENNAYNISLSLKKNSEEVISSLNRMGLTS